jgi:hypothetical protein
MTLHRLFSRAAIPMLVLATAAVGGCNLDLDDLLDDGMDTEAADTDGGDTDGGGTDGGGADGGGADGGGADGGGADGGGADGAGADTSGGPADPSGELPAELVGMWEVGLEGAAIGFEFFDDGSYVQIIYQEFDDAGCATISQEVYAGVVEIDGASMVLSPVEGYQSLDQCGTVSEGTEVPDAVALAWSLGTDDLGDALTLDDGTDTLVLRRSADDGGGT